MKEKTAGPPPRRRTQGPARGSAALSSECSRAENTTACSHEEEMRGWERSDSEGGCRGVKCDRPSISVGRRK